MRTPGEAPARERTLLGDRMPGCRALALGAAAGASGPSPRPQPAPW